MVISKTPTLKEILSRCTEFDIFKFYVSGFTALDKDFSSELRKDPKPSCRIHNFNGILIYKDFGEEGSYKAVEYVMRKYDLSFSEALKKIDIDLGLGISFNSREPTISKSKFVSGIQPKVKSHKPTIIKVRRREWSKIDDEFWNQGNITKEITELFAVYPIDYYWIGDSMFKALPNHYTYDYYWDDDGIFLRKLYAPYGCKFRKWISNGGKGVYQGEGVLPKSGDLLIITKSLKDVMCLYSLGYTSIAPPNEAALLKDDYFNKQSERFDKIIVLYDNDDGGRKGSTRLNELFGLQTVEIPVESGCKDMFEYVTSYGITRSKKLLIKLL